ncbi:hypothetical protein [Kibdelosporangium aridum]|nr:hypothetical protein [Kibdelosporangium aridum]
MAVAAVPVALAAGANADPHSPRPVASGLHFESQVDGMRAGIRIDHCGVSPWLSEEDLGLELGTGIGGC